MRIVRFCMESFRFEEQNVLYKSKQKLTKKREAERMEKKILAVMMAGVMVLCIAGCGRNPSGEIRKEETKGGEAAEKEEKTEGQSAHTRVTIFAAKSLNGAVDELITLYQDTQPNVEIVANYDSSGTLMEQIKEGAACDIFFSADQKQMEQLDEEALLVSGTRADVVNNQVCVVAYKGSDNAVTGLSSLGDAKSLALADGSVPVGKYTRQAMVNAGMLPEREDVSQITAKEVADALNGIEINECANVGAVTAAVAEGSNEVGTVYKSDTYGLEDRLEILEVIDCDLTGDVIYPAAQTVNEEADERQREAAFDFLRFLTSHQAKKVYEKYYFDTDI